MEFRKKTTATLLIAILMISAFAFVAIAGPVDYWFTEDTVTSEGDVVSGVGLGYSSDSAARLYISGDTADNVKLRIPYTGTLASLTTFSYWTRVTGTDGLLHPYGSINIDVDDDDICDYVIVQWEVTTWPPSGIDTWVQTVWGAGTRIHVVDASTGLPISGFSQADASAGTATFGALKALSGWSGYDVLQVKIAAGMWTLPYALEGFVDDVVVNSLTYDFESGAAVGMLGTSDGYDLTVGIVGLGDVTPLGKVDCISGEVVILDAEPAVNWQFTGWTGDITSTDDPLSVTMSASKSVTANFELNIVSIGVLPTTVDFGTVIMGEESDSETVTITNEGNVLVEVDAQVIETGSFFDDYLRIDGDTVTVWSSATYEVAISGSDTVDLTLDLTSCTSVDTYEGTLIFWAEAA